MAIQEVSVPLPDYRRILRVHQTGRYDPTARQEPGGWWWATRTPQGPATLHLWWGGGTVDAEAWGEGSQWVLDRVPDLLGEHDVPHRFESGHPAVLKAQRNHPGLRIGRSLRTYQTLLPIILAQRVTTGEARRSWQQLVRAAGERAPGPAGLLLAPEPSTIVRQPYWWFHRFGVERKRADALKMVASHAARLEQIDAARDAVEARRALALMNGIGPWTIGCTLGPSLGDPDAVAVGDAWVPHAVCWALAGEPRGSDERMLELLEPYRGHRGRATALLFADGWSAPRRGPGIRIIPIAQW